MNSLQIKYFLALCRSMNFTKTAEELFVSQPAVSKQIAALENEIGVRLFTREYRSLKLTPEGEIFRELFSEMQHLYMAAHNKALQTKNQKDWLLRIGIFYSWDISCFNLGADKMNESKDRPDLIIESNSSMLLKEELSVNKLDLLIVPLNSFVSSEELFIISLGTISSRLFFSRSHALADRKNLAVSDFKDEIFYISNESPDRHIEIIVNACRHEGFVPKIFTCPNHESIITSIQTGKGVCVYDTISKLKNDSSYRYIEMDSTVIEIGIVGKKDNKNPLITNFIDQISLSV